MRRSKRKGPTYAVFGLSVPRRAAHWATAVLAVAVAALGVAWVSGDFEDPRATADALEGIGVRVIEASEGVVEGGKSFDVRPWLEEVDGVQSFLNFAGFAKDELRATIRGLGRFSESRHRRDLELALGHYGRFHRHLEELRGM
ncbi:MAG TPA: hypothetical protein VM054_01045 [bacterium]|nr:hypothetical protein [bacterium]